MREGFNPVPVHRAVTVNPKDLLSQDLFKVFRDAHQLLLIDLQVNGHHQLITQLLIQLIQQFPAHINHLQQRIMHFVINLVSVPFFQFGHKGIVLEQSVTLLVNFKLLQTQIRNPVGHIDKFICRRQRLLLLIQDTRQQQTASQHRNLLFDIAL